MKTALSIQDLSCVGRCSLTVALPVLSAMGVQCSVLPTAVLSTHTGFPNPHILPLTEHIGPIAAHFHDVGVAFDAVTTGYLASSAQAEAVLPLLRSFREQGSLLIADPAMGDHGKLYRGLDAAHVQAMADLCREADMILPNVTEAALLTGIPYSDSCDEAYLQQLCDALMAQFPVQAAVITGVSGKAGTIGFVGFSRQDGSFSYQAPVIPRQFHGTGDLFCAVFTGSILQGHTACDAGIRAADFVRQCVAETKVVTTYGVEFERQLFRLFPNN